ncbi:MAG: PqqD family protein [Phycicoccus sp.]|nr:PqqD family protein [Phycicoccus sp.]
MTHDPRIILSPDVAYVLDDDAVYVAVVPEGPIRVLEGAGAIIWEAIGDHRRVSEVIAEAADQAGLAAGQIGDEVRAFLTDLSDLGLIRLDDGDEP